MSSARDHRHPRIPHPGRIRRSLNLPGGMLPWLFLLGVILLGACSADTGSPAADTLPATVAPSSSAPTVTSPSTTPPETTSAPTTPEVASLDLSARGPYPVGVTTWEMGEGILLEVWYPAVAGTTGTASYDLRDFTPDFLAPLLANAADTVFEFEAGRDAEVALDGPFPLVVFSHGFSGMRVQSTFLTAHLASHGMVVAAPDHPSRDLRNVLGGVASGNGAEAVVQVLAAIDLALAPAPDAPGPGGAIDASRVALIGHSAGGGTVQAAAADPRVAGYIAMAAGGPTEGFEVADVPSLFMAGTTDRVVSASERTRPAHLASASPSWYLEIAQTGHNGFDDFCLLGGGTGIIGVAENAGLGAILQAQPALRTLGEDGCLPPAAEVTLAHPLIRHSATAWLQWLWESGTDPDALADPLSIEVPGLREADLDQFALGSILAVR